MKLYIVKVILDRFESIFRWTESYADLKPRDIEFAVGNKVFLRVSPWKKILRFGR